GPRVGFCGSRSNPRTAGKRVGNPVPAAFRSQTMNPMVRKELNLRMRERRGWILPTLYLLGLGATVIFAYYMETSNAALTGKLQGATVGATAFVVLSYTQLALLLILAPVFSAGALTIEKEQRTLAGLITSLLRPWEIWFGKLSAAVM